MNRGDAQYIVLSININGEPLEEGYPDDIELTFNAQATAYCVQKSLKKGTIQWNSQEGKYVTFLNQADTYTMKNGLNTWQLRLLKNENVISTSIGKFILGETNSREVI